MTPEVDLGGFERGWVVISARKCGQKLVWVGLRRVRVWISAENDARSWSGLTSEVGLTLGELEKWFGLMPEVALGGF